MVAIFTGLGSGFERGSGAALGGAGLLGSGSLGRSGEGVSVNAANGNLLVTQRDEFLAGRGLDASILRTYNSQGALDENGDHWRQSTDRRVFGLTGTINTSGSTVKRVSADGSEITYTWISGTTYRATDGSGAHDTLSLSSGVWTWTDGATQWKETYAAHGTNNWRITTQVDNSGNTLTFTYTGDKLTRLATANGEYVDYTWTGNNITAVVTGYTNLANSTAQTLTRTRYAYDGQNRLQQVIVDLTPNVAGAVTTGSAGSLQGVTGESYITTYTYHGSSRQIATIAQTDGSQVAFTYDGSGRITQAVQTVASGETRTTAYAYAAGVTTITDPRGQLTRLFYDAQGQLTKVEAPAPAPGASLSTVTFTYDGAGNLMSMTDAAGSVTQYRYDAQGNVSYIRHPDTSTTLRVYDLANNLVQEIHTGAAITLPAGAGNQAPQAATNTITVTQQQGGSISLDIAALFSDPGDTLTYSVSGLPAGASFNGQFITGTLTAIANTTITATANDGTLSTNKTFTLSVVAPSNQPPQGAASVDVVTQASGGSVTLDLRDLFDDPENNTLTFSVTNIPPGMSRSGAILSGTPTTQGTYNLVVTASDGVSSTPVTITIVVTAPAGPPPLPTIPSGLSVTYGTSGDDYLNDTPGNHIYDGLGGWNMVTVSGLVTDYDYFMDPVSYEAYMVHKTSGELTVLREIHGVSFSGNWDFFDHYYLFGVPNGTSGDDTIVGSSFNNQINAGSGTDYIYSGLGNDYIDGGSSAWDRVNFIDTQASYTFLLHPDGKLSAIHTATGKHDVIWNVEYFAFRGGPWGESLGDLNATSVAYAAPAFVANGGGAPAAVTGFSNVVFGSGGGSPATAEFNIASFTFTPAAVSNVTVSGAHITAGLGDTTAGHTRLVYDTANRLRYTVSGEGNVREYIYDANGLLLYEKDYPNHEYTPSSTVPTLAQMDTWRNGLADRSTAQVMEYRYDVRGNLIETVRWGAATTAGAAASTEGYQHAYFTYDQAGRLLSRRTAPDTQSDTFVYDGLGRMTATTSADGGTTTIAFQDSGTTTTVTTSPSGHVTTSTYNKAGELIAVTDSGTGIASQATANRTFFYNANGQLQRTVVRVFDTRYDTSYILYDLAGRKVADIGHNGELTEYRYDLLGRVVATIRYATTLSAPALASLMNPDGLPAGGDEVLLGTIRPGANASDIWQWTTYDTSSRIVRTVGGDGSTTTFAYDASDRLVSTRAYFNKLSVTSYMTAASLGPPAGTLPATDTKDAITRTFYDRDGRVTGTLNAEGHLNRNIYDEAGQLVETTVYAGATSAGLRASGTYQQLWDSVTKDAAKDITTRFVYDGQGLLRFTIDALGRVSETIYFANFISEASGAVRSVVQHAAPLGTLSSYTHASVKAAVAALGLKADNRSSWMIYNDRGQLAFTVDPAGAVTGFTYDTEGRVTKTVQYAPLRATTALPTIATMNGWAASNAADARTTRTYYSARGEVLATIDPEGFVTRTYYHAEGQLRDQYRFAIQVTATDAWTLTNVDSALTGNFGTAQLTQYRLDRLGRVSDVYDPRNTRTYFEYSANGQMVSATRAYGNSDAVVDGTVYDQAGRKTSETIGQGSANPATTTYSYDGLGNLSSTTDPRGTVTSFTYDKLGRVLTQTRAVGQPEQAVTTFQYDAFGQVVRTIDARNNASFSYYDQAGRLVRTVDAENYMTTLTYTAFGEVASSKRWYERFVGTPVVGTLPATPTAHALDATSSFTYDRLGRSLRVTDALTSYDEYTYNAFGDLLTHRNKLGGTTVYVYDRRGLRTQETIPATVHNSAGTQIATSIVNRFEYDSRGNRTKTIEAYGLAEQRTTTYVYNLANELVVIQGDAVIALSSPSAAVGSSTSVPTESFVYDLRGNVIQHTDANGTKTFSWYDQLDRVTHQLVQQNGTQGTLTRNTYDAGGNLTEARVYASLVTLPANAQGTAPAGSGDYRVTNFTYDRLNRMATSVVPSIQVAEYTSSLAITSQSLTTTYTYDANGNVIRTQDPNGGSVYAYYDKLGRKTASVDQSGYLTRFWYDAQNNVTQETRYAQPPTGTISTASFGTIVENWPSSDTATALAQAHQDRVTSYTYDVAGRRATESRWNVLVHDGNGQFTVQVATVSFYYNALGQVTYKYEAAGGGWTNYYEYDVSGRLVMEQRQAFGDHRGVTVTPTTAYRYDGLGNLVRMRVDGAAGDTNDAVTTYTYGAGGRLASVTDAEGFVRTYRYDVGGRVVREEYLRLLPSGASESEGIVYTYDAQGRVLDQYVGTAVSGAYTAYNIINHTRYNAFGEVSQRGMNDVLAEQFTYDKAGRLIATNSGDGVWKHFLYDRNGNQTLAVTSAGADLGSAAYDTMAELTTAFGGAAGFGTAYLAGINATITRYDARGLAIQVIEPQRQLSAGGARVTLTTSRTYNAFGEIRSETNARGHTVDYMHNTMGRVIRTQSPLVDVTSEAGVTTSVRPTEYAYYDRSGRLTGTRDANGNLTRMTLLIGTGYGGAEALVTQVMYADNSAVTTGYDIQGNARKTTDQIARVTNRGFDRVGRMTQVNHPNGLIDYVQYDGLGQQIRRWNNQYGSGVTETTHYDRNGRVLTHAAMGGDITSYAYSWNSGYATTGLGTFGGWQTVTTYANTKTLTVREDQFGRQIYKSDLGGNVSTFTYDKAGQLLTQAIDAVSVADQNLSYVYLNTGKLSQQSRGAVLTAYTYDNAGNLLTEVLSDASGALSSQTSTYDALGRMLTWSEAGSTRLPAASISWKYDANGNIRNSVTNFNILNAQGNVFGAPSPRSEWYRFDSLNRVVTNKGRLIGSTIVRGPSGEDIFYDAAGQRTISLTSFEDTVRVTNEYPNPWDPYDPPYFDIPFTNTRREDYTYDAAGRITAVHSGPGYYDTMSGTPVDPYGPGYLRASFTYDLMGRQTRQSDYDATGTNIVFDQYTQYNTKGQAELIDRFYRRTDGVYLVRNWQYYGQASHLEGFTWANYALGSVTHVLTQNFKKNQAVTPLNGSIPANSIQTAAATTTDYIWFDGAQQGTVTFRESVNSSGQSMGGTVARTTYHIYDASGTLTLADINDARSRDVTFTTNSNGQVVRRQEVQNAGTDNSPGDPTEVWYRFGGKELGYTGNNGTQDSDYATSIIDRMAPAGTGAFRNGSTASSWHAEFDPSTDRISSYNQGSSAGGYQTRAGETLASIAANLWGDSSLWYKLAEANGLSGQAAISEGQSLRIPAGVIKNTHNASTFQPYDPNDTIGDTAPTAAKPPKKNKCGSFGQVLLVVVAVAVATITQQHWLTPQLLSGTFGAAAGVASGAAAGAVGSIASQAVGVATGIQEKFSWNSVAMAAIGGGVGGGMGLKSYSGWGQAAVNAAGQSIVSQGIGMALGLQSKFSWAGVAAAGVSGGVGYKVGKGVEGRFGDGQIAAAANTATVATASSIAHAATRSVFDGSNFGDNLRASIPDIIGQATGGLLADAFDERVDSLGRDHRISAADQRVSKALSASMSSQSPTWAPNGIGAPSLGASASDQLVVALPDSMLAVGAPDAEAELLLGRVKSYGQDRSSEKIERHARFQAVLGASMAAATLRVEQRALKPPPQFVGADPNSGGRMFHTPIDPLSDEWMSLRRAQALDSGSLKHGAPYDPLSLHTLVAPDGSMSLWVPQGNPLKEGQLLFSPVVDPAEAQLFIQLTEAFGAASGWLRMANVRPNIMPTNLSKKMAVVDEGYTPVRPLRGLSADATKGIYVDAKGDIYNLANISTKLATGKQQRHIAGPGYSHGGYFDSMDDAKAALDAFHRSEVEVLAVKNMGKLDQRIVFRYEGVTGTHVSKGAGYPNQPTSIFELKGTKNPSLFPRNPNWSSP